MTFAQAYKIMPACLVGALDRPSTLADLRYAAQHEIDMFEEKQDGCLTALEIKAVRKFLAVTAPRPDWLYQITYDLADGAKTRILIDGARFAVVQSPGGRWGDNSGTHYGATTFYFVDKQQPLRKGRGLLNCYQLQHAGRAKTAKWKRVVNRCEALGVALTPAIFKEILDENV